MLRIVNSPSPSELGPVLTWRTLIDGYMAAYDRNDHNHNVEQRLRWWLLRLGRDKLVLQTTEDECALALLELQNGTALFYCGRAAEARLQSPRYLTRSNRRTARVTGDPGRLALGAHADVTVKRSPSSLWKRTWSVPVHAAFQETSTVVTNLSPSSRYMPVYATMVRNNAARSSSVLAGFRPSPSIIPMKRP